MENLGKICEKAIEMMEVGWSRTCLAVNDKGDSLMAEVEWKHIPLPEEGACGYCLSGSFMAAMRAMDIKYDDDTFKDIGDIWFKANEEFLYNTVDPEEGLPGMIGYNTFFCKKADEPIASVRRMKEAMT